MKIRTISVTAGCTFNVPHEPFANSRPAVTFTADLELGDEAEACAKELQVRAETLVQAHKDVLVAEANARAKVTREANQRRKAEAAKKALAPQTAGAH